uniref:Uncharacterized protein n=1 Tax=Sinocyclocheilus anshuiensis TaxID=1608454 RepID=A0A671S2M5_9TELE
LSLSLPHIRTLSDSKPLVSNCTQGELQALHSLQKMNKVVVKPADKGGGIVLIPRESYDQEVQLQINNDEFYVKLNVDPTQSFKKEIDGFLTSAFSNQMITETELQFLTCKYPVRPVLYVLPKVHKTLQNPRGRPIVSCIGSLTEPLSIFIDHYLRPIVAEQPSYLRDTMNFNHQLKNIKMSCRKLK